MQIHDYSFECSGGALLTDPPLNLNLLGSRLPADRKADMGKFCATFDAFFAAAPSWLRGRTILLGRSGSHAYGTATPTSDLDLRGVAIAPRSYYLGFSRSFERYVTDSPTLEGEVEELRIFMRKAAEGIPQVLGLLFCEEDDILVMRPAGALLRASRTAFLSQRLVKPFAGHAKGVLYRANRDGADPVRLAKEAMHGVRIARTLHEVLTTGEMKVRRADAGELLAIRRGDVPLGAAHAEIATRLSEVDALLARTSLPQLPDLDALDALCAAMVDTAD